MPAAPNTIAPMDETHKVSVPEGLEPEPVIKDDPPAPVATPEPASQETGDSQPTPTEPTPPKAEVVPEKSAREKLISKLIGEEEVKPSETDDEPVTPAATAPTDTVPTATDGNTPNSKKQNEPPAPAPEDDLVDVTNDTVKAMKPGEARRKITRLIERVKTSESLAEGYKEIIDVCEQNGFSPDDYKAWVNIGVGVQQGDAKSIQALTAIAKKLGLSPEASPAMSPELDAWISKQAEDMEITSAAANELRKKLGPAQKAAPPAPVAPAPVAPVAPPQQQQTSDPARSRATQAMTRIADEYEKKIGSARFSELEPRIKAALAQRKGSHPDAWPDIFRSVVEAEIAKAPKVVNVTTGLRPGTSTSPATPATFKSERERIIHKYTTG